jgi:hypothetical protein
MLNAANAAGVFDRYFVQSKAPKAARTYACSGVHLPHIYALYVVSACIFFMYSIYIIYIHIYMLSVCAHHIYMLTAAGVFDIYFVQTKASKAAHTYTCSRD